MPKTNAQIFDLIRTKLSFHYVAVAGHAKRIESVKSRDVVYDVVV